MKPPVSLLIEIVAIIGSLYAGFDFEDEKLCLRHNGIDGETKRGTGQSWCVFRHAFVESWYQSIFNVDGVNNKEGARTFCRLLESKSSFIAAPESNCYNSD